MNEGWVKINQGVHEQEIAVLEIPYTIARIQIPAHPVAPLMISAPAPFPHDNTKDIPWKYDPIIYREGREDEPMKVDETVITNIAGPRRITCSGRVFTPTPTKEKEADIITNQKGKEVVSEGQGGGSQERGVPSKEVDEFLRLIKKSYYQVVDQLNQTPSKISMLSLLLSAEAHRESLMMILNTAHVAQNITVGQFDGVIVNITAGSYLGFNDDGLPTEGTTHNKTLHIFVKCEDTILSRLLVDTGSSLNVMPKSTLAKLKI